MRAITGIAACAILAAVCPAASGGAHAGATEASRPASIVIDVVGNSIIGIQYQKRGELEAGETGYIARYWVDRGWGRRVDQRRRAPNCTHEVARHDPRVLALMRFVQDLGDWGKAARCCDHPWSEIELRYEGETGRALLVGDDVFDRKAVKPLAACFGG